MPFNGSGTYAAPSLPGSFNPATVGGSATNTDWNTLLADISTALSTCVTKDGQTSITADISLATHKITNLGNATAQTDALNQQSALYLIDQQDATAVSLLDFTGIAATVNNLVCLFELKPSANGVTFELQTYGADGVLDVGGTDYSDIGNQLDILGNSNQFGTNAAFIRLSNTANVGSGDTSFSGQFTSANIQAATRTKFILSSCYFTGSSNALVTGMGLRNEADRITGIRISVSSGTFTGKVTLFGSV